MCLKILKTLGLLKIKYGLYLYNSNISMVSWGQVRKERLGFDSDVFVKMTRG